MVTQIALTVRPAEKQDRAQLANIIHFENHVHRHLDWRTPLEWLGRQPFLVVERGSKIVAALACPPDPPGVAWVRVFAVSSQIKKEQVWDLLWQEAKKTLLLEKDITVAAIPLHDWFVDLLKNNKFTHSHNVVVLVWDNKHQSLHPDNNSPAIRMMGAEDLVRVRDVDHAAFGPLWRNSLESIQLAYKQSTLATVIEDQIGILGYQISTPSPFGAHLARLAVHPRGQGQGLGYSMVHHLQNHFTGREHKRISVNTQDHNTKSLKLYKKSGFVLSGETYPVYHRLCTD